MITRPYTAVLIRAGKSLVIDIDAALERHLAFKQVQLQFPGDRIVALIPGVHAGHSYAFSDPDYYRSSDNSRIDLFDTSYITNKDE